MVEWVEGKQFSAGIWQPSETDQDDPEAVLESQDCARLAGRGLCIVPWVFSEYWHKSAPRRRQHRCHAFYLVDNRDRGDARMHVSALGLSPRAQVQSSSLSAWISRAEQLEGRDMERALCQLMQELGDAGTDGHTTVADLVSLHGPLVLESVEIPKSWGCELWYSGIEERGVSRVASLSGSMPLAQLLAALPRRLSGSHATRHPILLKELLPHNQPLYGDLYFELHEEKREVYVVTDVDKKAWHDGCGKIRLGLSPEKQAQYSSEQDFRSDYLACLRRYESARRRVEQQLEERRQDNEAIPGPEELEQLRQELPEELLLEERDARESVEEFSVLKSLSVGDVVKIPLHVPHALQHGVRVIEFQTPVYERKIISFAQKVLTQATWDSEAAIDAMRLDLPEDAIRRSDTIEDGIIASFEDFVVHKLTVSKDEQTLLGVYDIERDYALAMVLGGELCCHSKYRRGDTRATRYKRGAALFIPPHAGQSLSFHAHGTREAQLLLSSVNHATG